MRYLFIMNPGSKSGKSRRKFDQIIKILNEKKTTYDVKITKSLEEAYLLSREGNMSGYDVIVAVGGDGTINRVLNGFYQNDGTRLSGAKMGVIYTGTSPDFCKSYGIPTDPEKAVQVILAHKIKNVGIGRIVLAENCLEEFDGEPISGGTGFVARYFACCANIGLGAAVARRANGGIRGILGDSLGTFIALLRTLISYKPQDFMICCEGKKEQILNVYNISIGRTFYIASGIKVKNDLKNGDNSFYKMIVRKLKFWHLPGIIRQVYSGKQIINNEMISLDYLKTVEVFGNSKNPEVEFDGDPAGFLPCYISMAEDDLELIYEENL